MLTPGRDGKRLPWGYVLPKSADDLIGMGRCFSATTFLSAGNITHTPAYGHLIALGVLGAVQQLQRISRSRSPTPRPIAEHIAQTGRFLTFSSGAPTIGYRMRPDPAERVALRIVRETDCGVVLRGKIGMHTSPAYAEDVYVGALCGVEYDEAARHIHRAGECAGRNGHLPAGSRRATPIRSPRRSAAATTNWTGRCGWMMCTSRGSACSWSTRRRRLIARWLFWHQLYCWLSKAEVTLGLALACTHAMGLMAMTATIDYLLDLMTDVQTVRSCQVAAERDPQFTPEGYCYPKSGHLAAGSIAMLKARPRMSEILRIVPGFLARRRADRPRPCRARDGRGTGGIVQRRRLHRVAARGAAADGMGPRVLGTGRP